MTFTCTEFCGPKAGNSSLITTFQAFSLIKPILFDYEITQNCLVQYQANSMFHIFFFKWFKWSNPVFVRNGPDEARRGRFSRRTFGGCESGWKITMLLIGKPSISMGHLYHGELLVITRLGTLWPNPRGISGCSFSSNFHGDFWRPSSQTWLAGPSPKKHVAFSGKNIDGGFPIPMFHYQRMGWNWDRTEIDYGYSWDVVNWDS